MTEKRFALLIANYEYDDVNLQKLTAPAEDIRELEALLRDPQIGHFDEVTSLINKTVQEIRLSILHFFLDKVPEDLLLLYFSGHGMLDTQSRLFLATRDTSPELLRATALPSRYISEEMDQCRSRRQILILDCCYSGAFASGIKSGVGSNVGTKIMFQGGGYGRVILTATDKTQVAWEGNQILGEINTSFFTHYLIEGIKTGDANPKEELITVDAIYDYIYDRVKPKQNPQKWSFKAEGQIIIAHNPNIRQPQLSKDIEVLLDHSNYQVRLLGLDDLIALVNSSSDSASLALEKLERISTHDLAKAVQEKASNFLKEYAKGKRVKNLLIEVRTSIVQKDWSVAEKFLSQLIKEDAQQLEIDDIKEQIKQGKNTLLYFLEDLNAKFEAVASLASEVDYHEVAQVLSRLDRFQLPIKIAIVGEFCCGKTTLLNALLNENLLPTDFIPNTKILTDVIFGKTQKIQVRDFSGMIAPKEIDRETLINEYSFQVDDYATNEKIYIQIETPNPFLADGIQLSDNPGIQPSSYVYSAILKQADIIIIVAQIDPGIGSREVDFLQSLFSIIQPENVFIVLNKIDTLRYDLSEALKFQKRLVDVKIKNITSLHEKRFFAISALEALKARSVTPADTEKIKESRILDFERELKSHIQNLMFEKAQRKYSLFQEFAGSVKRYIEQIRQTIEREETTHYTADYGNKYSATLKKLEGINNQLDVLIKETELAFYEVNTDSRQN
ncbi:MAG: dynamin family protein [Ardenticatenaceae bacterium]|nr:dynamin family protein [Ardenticatenaceae bacterium]